MHYKLNQSKIDYIFFHLNFTFFLTDEIKNRILVDETSGKQTSNIIFGLSSDRIGEIKYINDIPILFPLTKENAFYSFDENKNLIFADDLFKSAFYLLSGYQETLAYEVDQYDRFSYKVSIQKKLDIACLPLVNIYFEEIAKGIEEFCEIHNLSFSRRNIWGNNKFAFLLTHDVDRVDKYTIGQIKYSLKQLFGFAPSKLNKAGRFIKIFEDTINFFRGENPYWNFKWMKSLEEKFNFNSTWFFLPEGDKNIDAHFSFTEERIKNLADDLLSAGDEIGLHGTYRSYKSKTVLKKDFDSVQNLIRNNPLGNRQHWLRFKYPETLRNLEDIGIRYDSSWAFHDHIGWRNSYCLPFRPYDIEQDRMMDLWEFPLTVMDVTLFEYQNFDQTKALEKIEEILKIVEKYNGMFTLLWHNSQFELENGEDLKDFYISVLEKVNLKNPKTILPSKLIGEL